MTTAPLMRFAATVLLLRKEEHRFSVFMVKRNRRLAFMPTAWVFPGGRVDEADALVDDPGVVGGARALSEMGLSRSEGLPFLVAAIRETLEESGRWLGRGECPDAVRDGLNADALTLGEALAQHDLVADLDRLKPWSNWVTPVAEPRRYDTRFFVARVEGDGDRHDEGETVDSAWIHIDEAVRRAECGELPMAPPTWWTLCELQGHDSLDHVMSARRPSRPICPILTGSPTDLRLLLPGNDEHTEPAIPGIPTEVRFSQGRWWATS